MSIVPSVTELIYALNLQDGLVGVSDRCNYPADTKNKEKIGSLYGVNKEKILKIRPTYTFALDTSAPFLLELKGATKLVYFKFDSVEDIFSAIHTLGNLFGVQKRSDALVANIQKEIKPSVNKKTILYVIQSEPLITIGKNSYLTDVIRLSGNVSATSNVDGYYPSLSKEYIIKLRPDYVVVGPYASISALKPILKNSKFVTMTKEQNDIINRPAARIGSAVGFFSQLK